MSERFWGNGLGFEQSAANSGEATVERAGQSVKSYRERGVIDMIGPALVELANAYERRGQISRDPIEDLASEIDCRIEAATYLSESESRMYEAWRQRHHAVSDLLDDDGRPRLKLAEHPKIAALDLELIRRSMADFEIWASTAKTPYGTPRYNPDQLQDVSLANKQMGILGIDD